MSQLTPPLSGRRILVTGAATGIGAAAVDVLAEAGAAVAATYHQTPPPDDLAATWLQCDVRRSIWADGTSCSPPRGSGKPASPGSSPPTRSHFCWTPTSNRRF